MILFSSFFSLCNYKIVVKIEPWQCEETEGRLVEKQSQSSMYGSHNLKWAETYFTDLVKRIVWIDEGLKFDIMPLDHVFT